MPWALIMPAFLLFFGIKTVYPDRKITYKIIYYLPFIIWLLAILVIRVKVIVFGQDIDLPMFYRGLPFWGEIVSAIYNLGVIVYLLKCINQVAKEDFSIMKIKPQLKWFKHVLLVLLVGTLLWLFSEIAFLYEDENFYFYPLWIFVSVIIYWLGHIGIYKYGIAEERKKVRQKTKTKRISTKTFAKTEGKKASEFKELLANEKLYLDATLTLEKVATRLEISPGYLSKIINEELKVNFKEHVNALRVEQAKSYLVDKDFANYTLVSIGLESGFNSKSAFHASFKKITGDTPSSFRKNHLKVS